MPLAEAIGKTMRDVVLLADEADRRRRRLLEVAEEVRNLGAPELSDGAFI